MYVAKIEFEALVFAYGPRGYFVSRGVMYAGLIELIVNGPASMTNSCRSMGLTILCIKSQYLLPGKDPGKDACMPKPTAVVQLPDILSNKSSHLVKLAGKIDSFSLLLRDTPEGEMKRTIEDQFHEMVFATRKEIRRYCPR